MSEQRVGRIFTCGYHEEGDDLIYDIWGRDTEGEKFHLNVHGTQPYLCAEEKVSEDMRSVKSIEKNGITLDNKPLYKINTYKPYHVPNVRDRVDTHYEADIVYKYRIRYDNGWRNFIRFPADTENVVEEQITPVNVDDMIEPRYCILDIEVMDEGGFEEAGSAKEKVVTVTMYDSTFDKYACVVLGGYMGDEHEKIIDEHLSEADEDIDWDGKVTTVPTERDLFKKIDRFLKKSNPDVITGWNFIDYDYKYLKNRAENIGYDLNLKPYEAFDIMAANDRLSEGKTRNKLNVQADKILGVGKLDVGMTHEMYGQRMDKLVAYNMLDVILTKEIDDTKETLPYHMRLSRLTGNDLRDTRFPSDMVDSYILYRVQNKVRLPSKEYLPKGKMKGGHVGTAESGRRNYIAVIDFKSEYPLIMITFGISPDNLVLNPKEDEDYITTPLDHHYKKEEGIVPKILKELIEERDELKAEMKEAKANDNDEKYERLFGMQRALKFFTNSFFGLIGAKKSVFRLANEKTGGDITAFAREHIHWTVDELKKMGYRALYGDTDSIFIQLEGQTYEERHEEVEEIVEELNESYIEFAEQYGAKPEDMELQIDKDKIFETWIQQGKKKKYAGLLEWDDVDMRDKDIDDRMYVRGFEMRRSNEAEITDISQDTVLKKVLKDESKGEIRDYILSLEDDVFGGGYDKELGIEAVITKPPEDYKVKQAHVKGWEWANNHGSDLDIQDPFYWYYCIDGIVRAVPYGKDVPDVIKGKIDYDRMWERNVLGKVDQFLKPLEDGFNMELFLEGMEQKGLGDF